MLFSIKCGQRLKGNIVLSEATYDTNFVVLHGVYEDLHPTDSSSYEIFKQMSVFAQADLMLASFKSNGWKLFLYTICWILYAADNLTDFDRGLGGTDFRESEELMQQFPDNFAYRSKLMDSATQSAPKVEQNIVSKKSKKRKFDDVLQNNAEDSSENPLKRAKESK